MLFKELLLKLLSAVGPKTIILVVLFVTALISSYFFGKDNPYEEAVEGIWKKETGKDIDFWDLKEIIRGHEWH